LRRRGRIESAGGQGQEERAATRDAATGGPHPRSARRGADLPGAGGEAASRHEAWRQVDGGQVMRPHLFFLWVLLLSALGVLTAPRAAYAEPIEVSVQASATQVEVGEAFTVELRAMSQDKEARPSDPVLKAPRGFSVSGPSISSQSFVQMFNGRTVAKI